MDGWPLVTVAHDSAHMQLQAGVYGELMKLTYMHSVDLSQLVYNSCIPVEKDLRIKTSWI